MLGVIGCSPRFSAASRPIGRSFLSLPRPDPSDNIWIDQLIETGDLTQSIAPKHRLPGCICRTAMALVVHQKYQVSRLFVFSDPDYVTR
jgi:hypothetical protein